MHKDFPSGALGFGVCLRSGERLQSLTSCMLGTCDMGSVLLENSLHPLVEPHIPLCNALNPCITLRAPITPNPL